MKSGVRDEKKLGQDEVFNIKSFVLAGIIYSHKHYYYPTALRRVQITPKMSTTITWYLYSRGPVRQVSCR